MGGDVNVIPERWTVRAGGFYETAVADDAYANIDFSGGQMFGGSARASVMFDRWELALAYQLRFMGKVSVSEDDGRVYQQVPKSRLPAALHRPGDLQPALPRAAVARRSTPDVYTAVSHYLLLAVLYGMVRNSRQEETMYGITRTPEGPIPAMRWTGGAVLPLRVRSSALGCRCRAGCDSDGWPRGRGRAGPSVDAADLGQGPYSSMHMLLQKTMLNINVAHIDVRVDKATQAKLTDDRGRQAVLDRARLPDRAGGDGRQARASSR